MIGYILLGAAVLIIAALMYGHTEREHFTDIKGNFPKWTSVLDQVRRILDKSFEYDQAAFAKFATQQKELYDQAITSTLKNLGCWRQSALAHPQFRISPSFRNPRIL
jgi:hypothetical protein